MDKEAIIDINDFVLCPNGQLGLVKKFLNKENIEVENSLGRYTFKLDEVKKLNKTLIEDAESNPYFKDTLNVDLFSNNKLIPEVKAALLKISNEFVEDVEDGEFKLPIKDIRLVGSNASYNYTNLSDIDIHIIADIEKIGCENDFFVKSYFEAKRKIFDRQHSILIKGHPVEMYIEDSRTPGVYNGVYSLIKDSWIQVPSKEKVGIDDSAIQFKFDEYHEKISNAINDSGNLKDAIKVYKHLFDMRKSGLQSGGEFSVENLVFKKLRDNELIDRLRDYMYKERDKELSLESIEEDIRESYEEDVAKLIKD